MAQELSTPRTTEIAPETLEFFGGDELRIRCFLDKYALRDLSGKIIEKTPIQMWERVAREIASVEPDAKKRREWEKKFYWLLEDFRFIPGGRIMFGAGQPRRATLLNCYVVPIKEDSIEGIFEWCKEAARTYSLGGGVGCVAKGSYVITRDGVKRIEDVQEGEEVLSYNPVLQQKEFRRVLQVHRPIVRRADNVAIYLKDGTRLITSRWHPTLVFREDRFQYVPAAEVRPTDAMLVTPELHTLPLNSQRLHDPQMAWWTGAHLGDGTAYQRPPRPLIRDYQGRGRERRPTRVKFYNRCKEVAQEYARIFNERTGSALTVHLRQRPTGPLYEVATSSYEAGDLIDLYVEGLYGKKATRAEIPRWIWNASRESQLAFLAGLIDTDGHVAAARFRVEFNTSSKELAYGLKTLLALLGARAWISTKPHNHQGQHSVVRRCQCAYRVATSDTSIVSEIARYMVNPEKKRRLLEGTPPPNNRDPVAVPAFVRDFLKRHATYKRVGHLRYNALKGLEKGWINRKTFLKLIEAIIAQAQDPQVYYQALSFRSLCLSLTPVEKVVAGVEADEEFCDLTVEGNNNYFAGEGGLSVIHNTDISILRPKGSPVNNSAIYSSGSVSFMELFSTTTGTIGQSGRRGALMITISVDHPDVLDFIEIKNDPERRKVQYANISVRVTDEFMRAVERDEEFLLRYESERIGRFERRVRAREIWEKLVKNAWASAEPGVIFWDTVKRESTTEYNGMEVITTNPCSEIPLEAYGACCLGNVNLSKFVLDSFTPNARIDWPTLEKALRYAVRFLDDVLDYNADKHPLPAQREASLRSRRIGVGFTGFGDMLIKLGLKYDSDEAIAFTDKLFERIKHIVYDESTELAVEKGAFPAFDREQHLRSAFIKRLDRSLIEKIKSNGLRNAALLTVPPVGSGSVLAGCSSGIEPIFSLSYVRKSKSLSKSEFEVSHPLVREYMEKMGLSHINELPKTFVTAHEIEPIMRVRMQATIQKHIDHAISSTVNLAKDVSPETIGDIYFEAWKAGCKGITVYREGSREGILLTKEAKEGEKPARATLVPRPRPKVVKGKTYRMKTELGTVFITVNEDDEGIFEVFVQGLGKSGTSTAAFTEAIGRLISLALRSGVKPSAIIDQLSLIRGSRPVVQEDGTVVFSVPDAIAKAIAEYLRGGEQLTLLQEVKPRPLQPSGSNGHDAKRDVELCPSCGGILMFTNGCYICNDCGFSECD
jgi:ribonucleoside-diphosphate reductase alpha chain